MPAIPTALRSCQSSRSAFTKSARIAFVRNINPMDSKQIIEHLDRLCAESGIKGMELLVIAGKDRAEYLNKFIANVPGSSDACGGQTAEEAITKLRGNVKSPAKLAGEKREQAQKLILEAELIEREGAQAS